MADEIKQTILIEANVSSIQNDIKTLENQFKTSFANIGAAGIESFASIDAAAQSFIAQSALAARQSAGANRLTLFSSLGQAPGGQNAAKSDAAEAARAEKIRQDALIASRSAFKDFEDSVRSGSKNISGSFVAGAADAGKLSSSMETLLSVAKSLGIVFSVGFAINFVRESVTATGALHDLAEQTGFSAETLLKLKPIANDAGSSIEEFAKGVNQFQRAVIEGSPATVAALHKVGLTANELLNFANDPEGLLGKLSKGLANISDQATRVQVQRDLLARGGPRLSALFDELQKRGGLDKVAAEPSIVSNEEIAAVDQLGRSFDNAKISLQALVAVKFVSIVDGLKEMNDWLEKITGNSAQADSNISSLFGHKFSLKGVEDFGIADIFSLPLKRAAQFQEAQKQIAEAAAASDKLGLFRSNPAGNNPAVDLSKATFAPPGALPVLGPTETDAQRDFKKSLDEQIESLKSQKLALTASKEAAIENAAGLLQTKAAAIDLDKSNADLIKRLNEFKAVSLEIAQGQLADSLVKQNHGIEVQIASMTEGKAAAEQLALKYTLLDSKLQNIGPAAEAAAKRQKELNDEQARAVVPQTLKDLAEAKDTAQRNQVTLGFTFNVDEAIRSAVQSAIEKLNSEKDPRVQKLAFDAAVKLKPELDAQTFKSIRTELGTGLGLDKEFAPLLNKTFANAFDVPTSNVQRLEDALQKAKQHGLDPLSEGVQKLGNQLDQAIFQQAFSDINRDLQIASAEAQIFGRSFDLSGASVQSVQHGLEFLLTRGLGPSTQEAQALGEKLQGLKITGVFTDLGKDLQDIQNDAAVLGGAIDRPAETIDALTNAIKRLRAEGLTPLSPQIQALKQQLDDAKFAQNLAQGIEDIGQAVGDALTQLSNGAKFKDVFQTLKSQISKAITDALVTKPFQDFLKRLGNDVFGSIFGGSLPGGPGKQQGLEQAAATAQFSASTSEFSAAVAQFVAGVGGPGQIFTGLVPGAPINPVTSASDTLDQELGKELSAAAAQVEGATTDNLGAIAAQSSGILTEIERASQSAIGGIDNLASSALNALMGFAGGTTRGGALPGLGSSLGGFSPNISGGLLANWMGAGGGSQIGFGSAPAGVEGPLMANGGFFSSAAGGLGNWLSSAWSGLTSFFGFHEGTGGASPETATFTRPLPTSMISSAVRYHSGKVPGLGADEIPAILKRNEIVLPGDTRMTRSSGGSAGGAVYNFNFTGVTDADSFRRSRASITADLARAVRKGNKGL